MAQENRHARPEFDSQCPAASGFASAWQSAKATAETQVAGPRAGRVGHGGTATAGRCSIVGERPNDSSESPAWIADRYRGINMLNETNDDTRLGKHPVIPGQGVRRSDETAPVLVPRRAGVEPRVELIRSGDKIRAIDITCACGQRIRLRCDYAS